MTHSFLTLLGYFVNDRLIAGIVRGDRSRSVRYRSAVIAREHEYLVAGIVSELLGPRNPGRNMFCASVVSRWAGLDKSEMSRQLRILRAEWALVLAFMGAIRLVSVVEEAGDENTSDESVESDPSDVLAQAALNFADALAKCNDASAITAALEVVRAPIVEAYARTMPSAA